MTTQAWYNLNQTKVFELLKTRKTGLTEKEVKARQEKYGPNSLPEKQKASRIILFLRQFNSPLVYILLFAAGISLLLDDHVDMYVILAAVVINIIVGFIQENRAMRAMEKLKKIVHFNALVIRDGEEKSVNIKGLVPGDVISLEPGDKVPADVRLLESANLQINEARLTGESHPVSKDAKTLTDELVLADRVNMAFMGTTVVSGQARGVVCHIGIETELGKIAQLIKETKEEQTPLQKRLSSMSKFLGGFILLISLVIFGVGMLTNHGFTEMFTTSVAIAVAAIPEGLAVGVTVILAIGMQRILKRKGLVRKLVAAETLGSTTVICTDKTGTLTEGSMRVARIITNNQDFDTDSDKFKTHIKEISQHASYMRALEIGVLCNDAHIENEYSDLKNWVIFGNPTEKALILAGSTFGLNRSNLEKVKPRIDTIQFNSERKFMMTLHKDTKTHNIVLMKGAPEKVLEMSDRVDIDGKIESLSSQRRKKLQKRYEYLSNKGLRIIALAYKPAAADMKKLEEKPSLYEDFVFVGLMGIKDPLRKEAKETISLCNKAGIKTVMITGDHKLTAQAIAQELGLPAKSENIIEGSDLENLNNTQLQKKVKDISVYARVTPKDKLRIVDAWQANGEVVAMTGDGVNDAPALRSADIGVAIGSGTDITKETASLVILDDNFNTIVSAVRQGRVVFENIRKVVLYLLSDSFSEVVIIVGALIVGMPLPLLAAQILWVNLVTDGFPDIALTVDPGEKNVMSRPPIHRKAPIINSEIKTLIIATSLISGLMGLAIFYYYWHYQGDLELARTMTFTLVAIDSLFYVYSCRSLKTSILKSNPLTNPWLIIAVVAAAFLQLAAIYTPFLQNILKTVPLNLGHWGVIGIGVFIVIFFIEIIKYRYTHAPHEKK